MPLHLSSLICTGSPAGGRPGPVATAWVPSGEQGDLFEPAAGASGLQWPSGASAGWSEWPATAATGVSFFATFCHLLLVFFPFLHLLRRDFKLPLVYWLFQFIKSAPKFETHTAVTGIIGNIWKKVTEVSQSLLEQTAHPLQGKCAKRQNYVVLCAALPLIVPRRRSCIIFLHNDFAPHVPRIVFIFGEKHNDWGNWWMFFFEIFAQIPDCGAMPDCCLKKGLERC